MSANKPSPYYENHEFSLATASTDAALSDQGTGFPKVFKPTNDAPGQYASQMSLRTDQTITVKINATTNDAITIASTDSPFKLEDVTITEVYITNTSGNSAAIKILLTA